MKTPVVKVRSSKNNPWIAHVKEWGLKHPGAKYRDALLDARETYTKKIVKVKEPSTTKKSNPWMEHIKQWKDANPMWKESMTYKDVLKKCKETYTHATTTSA